jgi:hypothetical protein
MRASSMIAQYEYIVNLNQAYTVTLVMLLYCGYSDFHMQVLA